MTWTKLSDDFTDDCWTLSDAAFRLHVEGLTWSNRKLLNLRLAKADVRRFAKNPEAATELVASGWWSDRGDEYVVVHHGKYQRERDAVIAQQAANAENGRKGGRPSKATREIVSTQETQSLSESSSEVSTERDRTGRALEEGTGVSIEVASNFGVTPTQAPDDFSSSAVSGGDPAPAGGVVPVVPGAVLAAAEKAANHADLMARARAKLPPAGEHLGGSVGWQ